jgi:membrane associated rhomboid family serine protease
MRTDRNSGLPRNPERAALGLSAFIGLALGLVLGLFSMAGPLAPIVGAVLGMIGGAVVGRLTVSRARKQFQRDSILDREIGVIDGDIGAA